jgi:hypothetical protein
MIEFKTDEAGPITEQVSSLNITEVYQQMKVPELGFASLKNILEPLYKPRSTSPRDHAFVSKEATLGLMLHEFKTQHGCGEADACVIVGEPAQELLSPEYAGSINDVRN